MPQSGLWKFKVKRAQKGMNLNLLKFVLFLPVLMIAGVANQETNPHQKTDKISFPGVFACFLQYRLSR